MRSVDRVVVFEKIRALEERLDVIDNRLDTLFSSFYCSSESSSSESDYEPCKPTAPEKSVYLVMAKKSRNNRRKTAADKIKKYETERLIKYLREDSKSEGLELDNDFFTKLEEENITGHLFLKLTRQEFREFGMGLRPALELEDYIKKLCE
ncbi:hypothetical protein RhiirA1_446879 [Rhizophagus irregularis]|uniref:SAM domain-containing protein n=1 Tax=Rhizophagus irregularis TaxID=588596 RepID=A0A2N0QW11_9GLOM|nr:hypothetical protein RhiirA1_446879 [Rhizophagus irregularis]